MATDLLILDTPDKVLFRLQRRAARRGRSVADEAIEILDAAVFGDDDDDVPFMTLTEIYEEALARGLTSLNESTAMIRKNRDRADGRR